MSDEQQAKLQADAEHVLALVEEVEAPGDATLGGAKLEHARAALHAWVDTVTAVVSVPAFGRVTLLHQNGRQSHISSNELPFAVTMPVEWKK